MKVSLFQTDLQHFSSFLEKLNVLLRNSSMQENVNNGEAPVTIDITDEESPRCNEPEEPMDIGSQDIFTDDEDEEIEIFFDDTQVVLEYGEGKVIRIEDYKSLDYKELITDGIIDFYFQHFHSKLPPDLQSRIHIYESSFYSLLSTAAGFRGWQDDENKNPKVKRYERVKNLPSNKNVNIFDKDFIVVPCNDHEHWFLAIVCYPKLNGGCTVDGNDPVDLKDRFSHNEQEPHAPAIKQSCILVLDSAADRCESSGDLNNFLINVRQYFSW